MERSEGFPHQRMSVLPRPIARAAATRAPTRRLLVTDAGYFPRAAGHVRRRPAGAEEAIVVVCAGGTGWLAAAGQLSPVVAGTAFVLPSGVEHSYGAAELDPWTIWWCHLTGADLPDLLTALGADGRPALVKLNSADRAVALLDEITATLERGTTPATLIATAGMAWQLLALLAVNRLLPEQGAPLERAMRHLEDRIDGQVRVPELAAMVGLSPSHLSALFRRATGGGVVAHHLDLKMARARALLDGSSLGVAEIGRRVGMSDAFYFSRRFRAVHGMSPSAYRDLRKG